AVGGAGNPVIDNHSAVQWWAIDPTQETGISNPTSVLQRARIEDPTADNCHDGNGGTRVAPDTCIGTANQHGTFFAFPSISVNVNNDVLIGYTQFSALTYPNSAYSIRRSTDTVNTMRDPVVYRPGQANYNIGAGTGGTTARQNRWGDYSAAQTDPSNDTDFWAVQEYAGTVRDFGIGLAGNWETYWANVKPTTAAPSMSGNLIINEFRLRGPQGVRDEYVELYNPGATPVVVNTTDNSDGWSLVSSANGTTVTPIAVIPNGTVIPSKGHFLIVDNPDGATAPTLTYSLNGYPATLIRGTDSDVGWSLDLADNGGLAIFKTTTAANMTVATRMDSVGFSGIAAGLFKEGNGIPAMTTQPTTQFAFYRSPCPNNTPVFGSAMPVFYLDNGSPVNSPPNRVRDFTSDAGNNSTFGTLSFRRTVTNSTGGPVTRLRFRVVDITTFPAPGGFADLRARTAPTVVVAITGTNPACPGQVCTVQGTTLEEPPTQPNAGGFNSSLTVGTVSLSAPLANGASVNVNFLMGVQQTGSFRFFINVEALP
ncbi:MAG: lamin tail domain-containing protein, partial [Acidobacteria bacterium]|nr:lamin tail domain-containing protein [Acidobacteriota bacterium]